MTHEDRPAFAAALGVMAETLGQPLTTLRTEGYFASLKDLDIEDVLTGIERAMREETLNVLPTPGRIREFVAGSDEDRAEAAWQGVCEAVRRFGYYRAPQLPARALDALARSHGGWQRLCEELPTPQSKDFDRHRRAFLSAYKVAGVRVERALPDVVRGLLS